MIEDLIYKALIESPTLSAKLADYDGRPAVFYACLANDIDSLWANVQYPRCAYMVDWMHDAERTKSGTISIDVVSLASMGAPIDIVDGLVNDISGAFLSQDGKTYSLLWSRTDILETDGAEPKKLGLTVYFDIIAYPIQRTTTPDPVLSTMAWVQHEFPDINVIGRYNFDGIWYPTDAAPACYVRTSGTTSTVRPSFAVVWLQCNITIHIICPGTEARIRWLRLLGDMLSLEESIITDDDSPMFIKSLSIDNGSNPIGVGQLVITGEYGVLRKVPGAPTLNNTNLKYEGETKNG